MSQPHDSVEPHNEATGNEAVAQTESSSTSHGAGLPPELARRLRDLRDALLTGLVERDVPVRLALLAALSGEHILLIGPPGTAKSLVARRLHLAFTEATYFERLLTRFSVPEELFGPLSIKGLEEDRYERLTEAYLPKASIAFLDEIFKANSAILNALLTLLNEREFDNGARREATPLIAAIGASNELPEGEELEALFDRFLLRVHVGAVSKSGFRTLLGLRGDGAVSPPGELRLSRDELTTIRAAASAVAVPDDVIALLGDLREWCIAEQIRVSDRRWRKIVRLLQTAALTNGRDAVSIWDCWLLQHCIWNEPEQRALVYDWYAARAGASAAMDPSRLTRIVVAWEGRLKQDQESRSQVRDSEGHLLFKAADGRPTRSSEAQAQARRGTEPLFLAPAEACRDRHAQQAIHERTNVGNGYVRAELDDLWVNEPQHGVSAFARWRHRDTYLANESNYLMEPIALAPMMEPTRHKVAYIEACLKELSDTRQDVATYRQKLAVHIASLGADIHSHLWVTDDFVEPAARSLDETRREVDALLERIGKLHQGFTLLPREIIQDAEAPTAAPSPEVGGPSVTNVSSDARVERGAPEVFRRKKAP